MENFGIDSYTNLYKIKLDLKTMQALIYLDCTTQNKYGSIRRITKTLEEVQKNFKVSFIMKKSEFSGYVTRVKDSHLIESFILDLAKNHDFYTFENGYFSDDKLVLGEKINVLEFIKLEKKKYKKEKYLKDFLNKVLKTGKVPKTKIYAIPEKICLDYTFLKIKDSFYNLTDETKNYLLKVGYFESKSGNRSYRGNWLTENAANYKDTLASIDFLEALGFKIEKNDTYKKIIELRFFNELGTAASEAV
jgi:hypothetical protein